MQLSTKSAATTEIVIAAPLFTPPPPVLTVPFGPGVIDLLPPGLVGVEGTPDGAGGDNCGRLAPGAGGGTFGVNGVELLEELPGGEAGGEPLGVSGLVVGGVAGFEGGGGDEDVGGKADGGGGD